MNLTKVASAYKHGNCVGTVVESSGVPERQAGKPLVEVPDDQILPSNIPCVQIR